jgi:hypothetical protein
MFLELGIGAGLYRQQQPMTYGGGIDGSSPGPPPAPRWGPVPDASIGIGFEL